MRVRGGDRTVGDIASQFEISLPAVSKHLAVLERATEDPQIAARELQFGSGVLGRLAACYLESLATLDLSGYGYGISVTPLQLTQAYATLGNDGRIRPVSLVARL